MEKGRLNIPSLNKLGEVMAVNHVNETKKSMEADWENREVDSIDPNCVIVYGVKDGAAYGYAIQKDFDEYKRLARYMRELEGNGAGKDAWLGKIKWILPRAIHIDLIARGYPVEEMKQTGDFSEIDAYVEDHCPELKTTKLFLKKLR